MTTRLTHPHRRRGATVVLVALLLPVLLGFAALTLNVGYLYNVRAELQNTADAVALAGASGLPMGIEEVWDRATASAYTNVVDGNHLVLEDSDVELGVWDSGTRSFTPWMIGDPEIPDACRVTTRLSRARGNPVDMFFSGLFGHDSADMAATATATFATADSWDLVIAQDISYSFRWALGGARDGDRALLGCLKNHTNNASRFGFVTYTGTAQMVLPLGLVEDGYDDLVDVIDNLQECCWFGCGDRPRCSSGTNIAAGIDAAVNELLSGGSDSGMGQAIVVVSDGKPQSLSDDVSDEELQVLAIQAANNAADQGISVFTVYYAGSSTTPAQDVAFLESLTRGDGTFTGTPFEDELATLVWGTCASLPLVLVE